MTGGQRKVPDPLELELLVFVDWDPDSDLRNQHPMLLTADPSLLQHLIPPPRSLFDFIFKKDIVQRNC